MAATSNSIGEHEFIALLGSPQAPRTLLELDQRAGVDGTQFTDLGKKGVPFRMLSQVDTADFLEAHAKFEDYLSLTGQGSVELVQGGVPFPYRVKVLSIEPIRQQKIVSAMGGLNSPSGGWLEAVWDLLAVDLI